LWDLPVIGGLIFAASLIDYYLRTIPGTDAWKEQRASESRRKGYVGSMPVQGDNAIANLTLPEESFELRLAAQEIWTNLSHHDKLSKFPKSAKVDWAAKGKTSITICLGNDKSVNYVLRMAEKSGSTEYS